MTKIFVAYSDDLGVIIASKNKKKLLNFEVEGGTIKEMFKDNEVEIATVELI